MTDKTITPEAREQFLADLSLLSHAHGVTIYACGCCGGPSLEKLTGPGGYKTNHKGEYLSWRSVPYLQGYRAAPDAANPYRADRDEWTEWDTGHEDAEAAL